MKRSNPPIPHSDGEKILFYCGLVILIFAVLIGIHAYLFSNIYLAFQEFMMSLLIYFFGSLFILIPYHSRKNIFFVTLPVILYFSAAYIYEVTNRKRVSYILLIIIYPSHSLLFLMKKAALNIKKKDGDGYLKFLKTESW
ncbi:hypothetical protein [Chryseobacterium mucoviscidosis]|uniref:Uncharacterized protein n=1 Tax=Chryseobacterium mucoviscidosis TaxID=1945581 RepID=A0A202C8A4_9FLAO|nr:hypothetical protein [Chryseobacterium mucoviscidosis]OVE59938.1 hypothetical protein B0E34_04905 [Chryseobacterium mucoviscidosis]